MTDHLGSGSPSMTTPDEHQEQGGSARAAPGDTPEVASAAPVNRLAEMASRHDDDPAAGRETVFELKDVTVSY
ncbi:MAG: hypothetical protein QOJ31_2075, partial [Gaiellales bacterium]|nr:hypothetical protein [Gaiellales bacterium]